MPFRPRPGYNGPPTTEGHMKYDWDGWLSRAGQVELKYNADFKVLTGTMVKKVRTEALARGLVVRVWTGTHRAKRNVYFEVLGSKEGCLYVGIDPGKSGGLAVLDDTGKLVAAEGMPGTTNEVLSTMKLVTRMRGDRSRVRVCIEKVGGFTGRVGAGGGFVARGSHMFEFGRSTGWAEMAAAAVGAVEVTTVMPAVWQAAVGMKPRRRGEGGESDGEWKNRLKGRAAELFPGADITLKKADALLIAYWFWKKCETAARENDHDE